MRCVTLNLERHLGFFNVRRAPSKRGSERLFSSLSSRFHLSDFLLVRISNDALIPARSDTFASTDDARFRIVAQRCSSIRLQPSLAFRSLLVH
jgi:hypothetical protein